MKRLRLFDRTTRGEQLAPVELFVDERAIRFFAETLGMNSSGSDCPPAPPTFFTFVDAEADAQRRRRGEPTIVERIGCDMRYLLHGEEHYEMLAPILAGDDLTISARIADFYDSSSGHLEFAVVEQTVSQARRGTLLRARRLYIHKLPQ